MLLLLLLWVSLVATPKKTKTGRKYSSKYSSAHVAMSPREYPGGDQLARLVHREVGSSLRVMVQHARVAVGAASYYH